MLLCSSSSNPIAQSIVSRLPAPVLIIINGIRSEQKVVLLLLLLQLILHLLLLLLLMLSYLSLKHDSLLLKLQVLKAKRLHRHG
jgi:hypothetical protein